MQLSKLSNRDRVRAQLYARNAIRLMNGLISEDKYRVRTDLLNKIFNSDITRQSNA